MERVDRGASVHLASKPMRRPSLMISRSSSAPPWVPQKYALRASVKRSTCSRAKPSHEAPSLGCPMTACRSLNDSSVCSRPLSLMYTLGDLTWRFDRFSCQGASWRTMNVPLNTSM